MAVPFGGTSMMQIEETVQGPLDPRAPEVQHDHSVVNILLLGPTGVGKSTFINSLSNYCLYASLDEALKGDIQTPIYSEFSTSAIEGDDGEYMTAKVSVGDPDDFESPPDGKPGGSCTQKCKAYVFPFGESSSIRLIDTPGIADTRGGNVDLDNMENVLSFLSQYDVLHAVCILLKPNEVRLTTSLKYSIVKLLEKLHRDASNNILFCFTNSRITNFVAGDTLSLLKQMFQPGSKSTDSINLKLSFSRNTMYFFDSEAFRFQAMVMHGMKFTPRETEDYRRSWEQSNGEAQRLIEHILELEPHVIKDTLSLNRVRRMLESIQKPLSDIAANIQNNLQEIKKSKSTIKDCRDAISNCLDQLVISEEYQETVALDHPRTICTQRSCRDKICHDNCNSNETLLSMAESKLGSSLVSPIREAIGVPDDGILCSNLSFMTGRCKSCGCKNEHHIRESFEMRTATREVVNEEIRRVLEEANSDEEKKAEILEKVEAEEKFMKDEIDVVIRAAACFSAFLEQNSIVTYHSAVLDYYKEQFEQMQKKGNEDAAAEFDRMIEKYKADVRDYKQWKYKCQDPSFDQNKPITQKDVELELQKLYELPLQGPSLKEWAERQESVCLPVKGREEVVLAEKLPSATDHGGLWKDAIRRGKTNLFGRITGARTTGGSNPRSPR